MSHPFSSILDLWYFCRMELNFMWKLDMLLVQCLWSKSRKCTVTQSSFWFTATNFKQISNENKIMKFPRNKLIGYIVFPRNYQRFVIIKRDCELNLFWAESQNFVTTVQIYLWSRANCNCGTDKSLFASFVLYIGFFWNMGNVIYSLLNTELVTLKKLVTLKN